MAELKKYDYILVGAGIMSATLGTLIKRVKPEASILILERLSGPAMESSDAWNNAGTGHAALCELNYMPDSPDGGRPDPAKAVAINEQFQLSRQFWAYLVSQKVLKDPTTFIRSVPHMTFVTGAKDVDYLARRYEVLRYQPLFDGIEFSDSPATIRKWIPLVVTGRTSSQPIAATRTVAGTDVDYGSLTRQLLGALNDSGVEIAFQSEVKKLYEYLDGGWEVTLKSGQRIKSDRVFVGAGGWALKLLQSARIPEIRGYGTFPVSGHFFRTFNPELVALHNAKVYSQAAVGAPPMSVPHLDKRIIDGREALLFGPFAGLNPKFLKNGSIFDLPASIRLRNLLPYISVAIKNFGLVKYLITEITKSNDAKLAQLREFVPNAAAQDWELYEAGQRAQVIKPDANGFSGTLQFGTEVISNSSGTIAGLLGASPGASVAVDVMLTTLKRMHPDEFKSFIPAIQSMIPTYGKRLNDYLELSSRVMKETAKVLKLKA